MKRTPFQGRKFPLTALATAGAAAFLTLFVLLLTTSGSPNQAHAQDSPSVAISLSPSGSVEPGTVIAAAMSFGNLASDSDTSTTDYIFRADVKDSENRDADDCEGSGLGSGQDMAVVDEDPETRTGTISADCPVGDYTVQVSLSSAANEELASASVAFTIAAQCSGNPNPVGVDVEAVPIVVESTIADYFVLYVRHDLDADTAMELPVSVTLGQAGTTALAENVEALPKERYRVEKYLVVDPADVDGDCIDDITELSDPVGMNPVNPATAIDIIHGAVVVPDRETLTKFSRHSGGKLYGKFVLFGMTTARPGVYFMNTGTYQLHRDFRDAVGIEADEEGLISGEITYDPELVAPDGSPRSLLLLVKHGSSLLQPCGAAVLYAARRQHAAA